MDRGALEETRENTRVEELRASIDEIEEEIGVEVFINVMDEEGVKEREISEKIKRCEELREDNRIRAKVPWEKFRLQES